MQNFEFFSSISQTIYFILLVLYRNPKFWRQAQDEQREILKRHGEALNYDVLSEMDVLYRCIKEALRLHPPLILLLRYNHKDFTVKTRQGNEYVVPKNHIVATSPAFANRLTQARRGH